MPIVSGFLTLSRDPAVQRQLCRQLNRLGDITLGEPHENRLPLVVASEDVRADREIWEAIARMDGVITQHIVHADFQDLYPEPVSSDSNESIARRDGGEQ